MFEVWGLKFQGALYSADAVTGHRRLGYISYFSCHGDKIPCGSNVRESDVCLSSQFQREPSVMMGKAKASTSLPMSVAAVVQPVQIWVGHGGRKLRSEAEGDVTLRLISRDLLLPSNP